MDQAQDWYISSASIFKDGVETAISSLAGDGLSFDSGTNKLTVAGPDVLSVSEGGTSFLLFRRSGPTSSFSVKAIGVTGSSGSRGLHSSSGLAGISAIIKNLKNAEDSQLVVSDSAGAFHPAATIPGDEYSLSVTSVPAAVTAATGLSLANAPKDVSFTPLYEGQDLGSLPISGSSLNIKVALADPNSYFAAAGDASGGSAADYGFRYPGIEYSFVLKIKNIGSVDLMSPSYKLAPDPDLLITAGATSGLLGTIEPGKVREIPLTVRSMALDKEFEFRGIDITLKYEDPDPTKSQVWEDRVDVLFWNRTITFNVAADSVINGVILSPEKKSYRLSGKSSYDVVLPWRETDYLVAFSGATADTEVNYKIGVNNSGGLSGPYLLPGNNAAVFEPNDTEAQAVAVNETITARLIKGDVDFYTIRGTTNIQVSLPADFSVTISGIQYDSAYLPPNNKIDAIDANGKLAISRETTFSGKLSHASDRYEWFVDGYSKAAGNLDAALTVPDLVIPAYGLLWGAHEVTLVVRKDSSLFEATTAFSSK